MIKRGTGGGNTITGLIYEGKVDLTTFLSQQSGYSVNGNDVFYKDEIVAHVFKKHVATIGVTQHEIIPSCLHLVAKLFQTTLCEVVKRLFGIVIKTACVIQWAVRRIEIKKCVVFCMCQRLLIISC